MQKIIDKLNKMESIKFLEEIQKEETPSLAIAYFAVQEQSQGNVYKRWCAKAELMQREHQALKTKVNMAKWSAIFSAISSFCALITILLSIFVK